MGGETSTTTRSRTRAGLRAKLVRAMVVTLVVVAGATVVTVGYMNYRSARATLATIETHIRQSIVRKGQGLATNHALALRGLVADNAFGDVARLVERSVREDEEMLYGLFLGADGGVWAYVPPAAAGREPGTRPDFRELGIDPTAAARPGAEATTRAVAGQEAFEFSASVAADDGAVLGRIFYGAVQRAARPRAVLGAPATRSARCCSRSCCCRCWASWRPLLGITIIRGIAARITRPLAHLTEVTTAIADGRRSERVVDRERRRDRRTGERVQQDAAAARRFVQEPRIAEPHPREPGRGADARARAA